MKTNAYTMAIDHIHVSESAIEAALAAAKLRASKTASSQAKVRYAAIAASVVLAGAASAAYFGNIVKFEPPVNPSSIVPTVTATQAEQPTEAKAVRETSAATEKHTQATEKAQATESIEVPISYSETNNHSETSAPDRQEPEATDAPVLPTVAPTQSAPDQPRSPVLYRNQIRQVLQDTAAQAGPAHSVVDRSAEIGSNGLSVQLRRRDHRSGADMVVKIEKSV